MEIFFRQLVNKLNKDRIDWRDNTIILLDNAPYHNSNATMKLFESLRIPVMFFGPHSYNTAPCELFFAQQKKIRIKKRSGGYLGWKKIWDQTKRSGMKKSWKKDD